MLLREVLSETPNAYNVEAYHGTGADFEAFEIGHRGSNSRESNIGIWFTNNPAAASDFADFSARGSGANVIPVRLRLRHPFEAISYDEIRDLVDRFTTFARPDYRLGTHPQHGGLRGRQIRMTQDKVDYDGLRQWMKSQGYDGIVLRNTLVDSPDGTTPIDQYVVFDANQIRSRFAKFDPEKADSAVISEQEDRLPDDTKSRMERAKAMGFTLRAYHGTGAKFKAFDLEKGTPHNLMGYAPYFSTVKAEAKGYADERKKAGLKTRLLDVLLRVKNPLMVNYWESPISEAEFIAIAGRDVKPSEGKRSGWNALYILKHDLASKIGWDHKREIWNKIYRHLKSLGYDAIFDDATPSDHHKGNYGKIVILDPKNIRSIKAKFDPAKSESSNLMD